MFTIERNGDEWTLESFDMEDLQISKNGQLMTEWVKGTYYFQSKNVVERDLAVILDVVTMYKDKYNGGRNEQE